MTSFKNYLNESFENNSIELFDILETIKKYKPNYRVLSQYKGYYNIFITNEASGLLDELYEKHKFVKVRGMNPHLIKRINDEITIEAGNPNWISNKEHPICNVLIKTNEEYLTEERIKLFDEKLEFTDEQRKIAK